MVQSGLEHPFLHESIKIHVLSTGTTSSPIYGYCITEVCISFEEYNCWLDDELKKFLQFLLTNDKFKPPNHKKLICFTLVCLWNVQIQILNQPKRPS